MKSAYKQTIGDDGGLSKIKVFFRLDLHNWLEQRAWKRKQ